MSSILRALKKLDEEAMPLEDQTGEPKSNLRQMVNRRARGPRFKNRILYISLAVVAMIVVAAAAALIFLQPAPEPELDPSAEKKAEALTTIPAETADPEPQQQLQTTEKQPVQQVAIAERKPEPAPQVVEQKPIPKPTPRPTIHSINPTIVKPNVKPEVKQPRPQLKLHGILWSDNKDRRVALIGERYLKEGDTINGATIVKIEKKSVTLQKGDDTWTIRVN